MELPKKEKIGGRHYTVSFPHVFQDTCNVMYGLHDPNEQTIKIAGIDELGKVRNDFGILQAFIHENFHAIDNVYNGGRLSIWDKGEEAIDQLSEGLLQVLIDNPEIIEAIKKLRVL